MGKQLVSSKKLVGSGKRGASRTKITQVRYHDPERIISERERLNDLGMDENLTKKELGEIRHSLRMGYYDADEVGETAITNFDGWVAPDAKQKTAFLKRNLNNPSVWDKPPTKETKDMLKRMFEDRPKDGNIRLKVDGFEEVKNPKYKGGTETDFAPQYSMAKLIDDNWDELRFEFYVVDGKIHTY